MELERHRLIVTVPHFKGHDKAWGPLLDRLEADPKLTGCTMLRWNYSIGKSKKGESLTSLARELNAAITEEWGARAQEPDGGYDSVILIGHSMGALLCRQAFLSATKERATQTAPRPWGHHVERIVLFSGLSRGMNWEKGPLWVRASNALAQVGGSRYASAWRDVARGSAFLTNLRINWLRYFAGRPADGPRAAPTVVQILGTKDTIVTRDDCVDVEQSDRAVYVDLDGSTHTSVVQVESASNPDRRYARLRTLILDATPADNPEGTRAENRTIPTGPERVIFLTHGIRNYAFDWPSRAAKMIKGLDPSIKPVIPTGGYFSALRFAFPITRRKNLRLFRDRYAEALARNPHARFDYIGHSNGTYLLGRNLELVQGMRFESAVLAASVLPPNYEWSQKLTPGSGQIGRVRVDYAAADFPVGVLCAAMNQIGMKDVGPGGFEGFHDKAVGLEEVGWYDGGHGKMVEDDNLPYLINYVLNDAATPGAPKAFKPLLSGPGERGLKLNRWAGPLVALAVLVLIAIIAGVVALVAFGVHALTDGWPAIWVLVTVAVGLLLAALLAADRI